MTSSMSQSACFSSINVYVKPQPFQGRLPGCVASLSVVNPLAKRLRCISEFSRQLPSSSVEKVFPSFSQNGKAGFFPFSQISSQTCNAASSETFGISPDEPSYGNGGSGKGGSGNTGGGGNGGGGNSEGSDPNAGAPSTGLLAGLAKGWNDRVAADSQFLFKVATEQIIGVTACVLGDMASRPNFGLNELDFVFCTLVVGSIVNFSLMYLLAPTTSAGVAAQGLPWIFSNCPTSHMFEAGSFSLLQRLGTFVYKGAQFSTVGFFAGLAGTALSNTLLQVKQKLDPNFVLQNKPPPTLLNSLTWAIHMGASSNLRYQCLNGLDQKLIVALSPNVFRGLAFVIRGGNNLVGGSTFVALAKLTGAQKAGTPAAAA